MDPKLIELTADVVSSYLEHNKVSATDVPGLIRTVHTALKSVGEPEIAVVAETVKLTGAQIRKSITPDFIVSFEDGKPYKSMKRHLAGFNLTPEQYRAKWGLPKDYPMVSPNYSEARSAMAKKMGLGARGKGGKPAPAPVPAPVAKAKAPRKTKALNPAEEEFT